MPNRILRDTTDSDKINMLSFQAEVFFYRLMMKADDYGVFHGKTSLLKAALFPLRLDSTREADITRWIAECEKAGLVALYSVDEKPYMVIVNFGQRMRNMKKRFPEPPDSILRQVAADCGELRPETRNEKQETKQETERESEMPTAIKINGKVVFGESGIPDDSIFEIEHCLECALNDDRWVNANGATVFKLKAFNEFLEGQSIYKKNITDYKKHYHNWQKKQKTEPNPKREKQPWEFI